MTDTVLLVSPYRGEYGPRLVLEHVTRALSEAGLRTVWALPPGAEVIRNDVTAHTVDELATIPRTMNAARLATFGRAHVRAAFQLADIAVDEGASVIYSVSEAIFCGSLAARRLGIPSIVHGIGMSIQSPPWVARAYIPSLNRITDQFVACSAAVAEMFVHFGVDEYDVTVVHNGIDAASVQEAAAGGPSPIAHRGLRIGMVAAYDPRKGHELFVEAAAVLARDHPDARFYMIGGALAGQTDSAGFEQSIIRLIAKLGLEDRVERPGFVPAPEVYRWIEGLDIVVVPSQTEAFAHALLEAMACGKAIVATEIEGNLDAFVHRHSGLYVLSSPAALAAAIGELATSRELRETLGGNARERVEGYFDLSVTLPASAAVVERLLTFSAAGEPASAHS